MPFVQHFVSGAFASRKIAQQRLKEAQPFYMEKLKVHQVKIDGSSIYYVVY